MRRPLALAAALVTLMSCSGPQQEMSRFYFGLSSGDSTISTHAFDAFVDTAITPLFPDGLTQYAARGQWRSSDGVVRKEPSVVVEIIHSAGDSADARIARIIASYKRAYAQESVLLVQSRPRVRF